MPGTDGSEDPSLQVFSRPRARAEAAPRRRRVAIAVGALLCIALAGTAADCSEGSGAPAALEGRPTPPATVESRAASGSPRAEGASASPIAAAATAAPAQAGQAPRPLPIAPVEVDYRVEDLAFDPLDGARAHYGEYAGGGYRIEVPERWNGDVVYFAHGFRGNPPALTVDNPPIREHLVSRGFAWAASTYSVNGYEPGIAARDTLALRDVVASSIGTPRREYLYGQSMGGHVVTFSLERYPDAYDGALSECGVVSGRGILDYFVSWAALAAYFTDVPLFDALDDGPDTFKQRLADDVVPALGPPDAPTDAGRAFADVVHRLSGGDRPFFREGYLQSYGWNFIVLMNAVREAGEPSAAASNTGAVYDIGPGFAWDAARINGEIHRASPNERYLDAGRYPEFAPVTGRIAAPLMSIHNTGDVFVPISLEQDYRRAVDATGAGAMLVQRAIRREGHCNFTADERIVAFNDLVSWVERGDRPRGDDLLAPLAGAGREWTMPLEETDPGGLAP